jgi:uncharacterized repeat protein (TIGR01451 family)
MRKSFELFANCRWLVAALWLPLALRAQIAPAPPELLTPPQSQSVPSGADVSFTVEAGGAAPLQFQWRQDGTNLPGATNAALTLSNVQLLQAGDYQVVVANAFGAVTSAVATLSVDDDLVFRVTALLTNGAIVLEVAGITGDDRGGMAVSSNGVFLTGDGATGRWGKEYLTGGASVGARYDALVSDLRTERAYTLANGTTPLAGSGTVTSLREIDGSTGALTTNRIDLSTNIFLPPQSGIFAGYGRVVLHDGTRAYSIALPSGQVLDLGELPQPARAYTESWAFWGLAEYIGGAIYLVYVRDPQAIVRTRVPDGATTPVAVFDNLSDMASLTFSPELGRWFFHHEGTSQFQRADETLGSAKADYVTDPAYPSIRRDPQHTTGYPGGSVTLRVLASGAEPRSYQWRFNGTNLPGATNSVLTLDTVTNSDEGAYSVEVSNDYGSVVSLDAYLSLVTFPFIIQGPQDVIAYPGEDVVFSVVADGAPPLTYQWRLDGVPIPDATNDTLLIEDAQLKDAGAYSVDVNNAYGQTSSGSVVLDFITTPFFLQEPFGQSVFPGADVLFTVVAEGAPPLEYQWRYNGTNIADATNDALLLTNVQPDASGYYSVVVSNRYGAITSGDAFLNVFGAPNITVQPEDRATVVGSNVTFFVQAEGAPPLRFQWLFNGADMPEATNSFLVLTSVQRTNAGRYRVRVSNDIGSALSVEVTLNVVSFVDDKTRFQIVSLTASGCAAIEHNGVNGDDRGGMAASSTHLFVTGDGGSARFALADLSGATSLGQYYDTLLCDLRTETVYVLGNGTNVLGYGAGFVNTLLEVNGTNGMLTGRRIHLTAEVPAYDQTGNQVGMFSGYGQVAIFNGARVYSIQLPSGFVRDLGPMSLFGHQFTESWAYWGVAEQVAGVTYLVYVADSITIGRRRVPDGQFTTAATFNNLSDMATFTASYRRGRWYFHHEGFSQFRSGDETVGYCNATFSVDSGIYPDRFEWGPINALQPVGVPFAVTLTAKTSGNVTASNYNGVVSLAGIASANGQNVAITPAFASNFVNGSWTGQVTVLQVSTNMYLRAADTEGVSGNSATFAVSTNDFAVFVSDAPDPALAGQNVTYTVTVVNAGPASATGVVLTNTLPAGVDLMSVSPSQGSCSNGSGIVRCALGTLPVGASATVTIVVTPPVPGNYTNRVTAARNEPDPVPANNSAVAVTTVTLPPLVIADASVTEGDTGTNYVNFTVALLAPSTNTVTVRYATQNGTAATNATVPDYVIGGGLLTFAPGETTQTVTVAVLGDTYFETNETFFVNLSNPTNASLGDAQGVGLILDNDSPPLVTVTDASVVEGNSGTNVLTFRVGLSARCGVSVQVAYATSNGTATAGSDYIQRVGVLNFTANTATLTQNLSLQVRGDTLSESNEFLYLHLLGATNGTLTRTQAVGTILADDGIGVLDRFLWDPITTPQAVGAAIPVRLLATDFFGTVMTNFNGTVALSGAIGSPQEPGQISGSLVHSNTASGNWTLGYEFIPTNDLQVTHVRSYYGTKVTIWTDSGALLASQNVSGPLGTWTETALPMPVQLTNGSRYRVACYTGVNGNYYWVDSGPTSFAHGLINGGWYTSGDGFPNFQLGGTVMFLVDLAYLAGAPPIPIRVAPTNSTAFTNGVWTGTLTALDSGTNIQFQATYTDTIFGKSDPFDVRVVTEADVVLAMSANPAAVPANSNVTFTITVTNRGPAPAGNVIVTNTVPPGTVFLGATTTRGIITNISGQVICNLLNLTNGGGGRLTITLRAGGEGAITNVAGVRSTTADSAPANNFATLIVPVCSDCDQDGLPDAWERANGYDPADASDAARDADGDGHTLLQEYLAGTDPQDANSVTRITAVRMVGHDLKVSFRGVPGKKYRLERLDSMSGGAWTRVVDFKVGLVRNVELLDSNADRRPYQFYRIRVLP